MQHVRAYHGRHRGFTLVEMLVVITIIGVLVALLVPTVGVVMRRTRNAAMSVEMQDLAKALEAYKAFANDYPPDFTNATAVANHIGKAFPRNSRDVVNWMSKAPKNWTANQDDTQYENLEAGKLDAAEALVFWLTLLSTNPRDPLGGADTNYKGERKVLFDFDDPRLGDVDADGWMEYYPKYCKERPYIYFDGRLVGGAYAYTTASYTPPSAIASPNEIARPYRSNIAVDNRDNNRTLPYDDPTGHNKTQWIKPGQFQIICAGLDNDFGPDYVPQTNKVSFKTFPIPNYPVPSTDEDNLTDFAEAKTLGDSVP